MGKKSVVIFEGNKIETDLPFLDPDKIKMILRDKVGKNRKLAIATRKGSELKPLSQIPPGSIIGQEVIVKSYPSGTVKGSLSRREYYIKTQVASIAEVYGERFGQPVALDYDLSFLFIPCFTLPRRWGLRTTPILLWLPQGYPDIPPNGFYLSNHCNGPHIFSRNIMGDSPDLSHKGWNWYCAHADSGWSPKDDPLKSDNLWTFLDIIRMSLSIREF